jgi:ATP-dependent Clp protease adaptor protein ClpS
VVTLLEQVFKKGPSAATQLMLQIHKGGQGIAGVYVLEVAETKAATVHRMAEERGYPLRAGVEAE